MERVLCLVMGYVFGLFQTGYLYSRSKHISAITGVETPAAPMSCV